MSVICNGNIYTAECFPQVFDCHNSLHYAASNPVCVCFHVEGIAMLIIINFEYQQTGGVISVTNMFSEPTAFIAC